MRKRQTLEKFSKRKFKGSVLKCRGPHRLTDFVILGFHIGAEKRLTDDIERQTLHLSPDVFCLSILPPFSAMFGAPDHLFGITSNALMMEVRLSEASLLSMKIAFAKQQPLTKESFGALVPGTF